MRKHPGPGSPTRGGQGICGCHLTLFFLGVLVSFTESFSPHGPHTPSPHSTRRRSSEGPLLSTLGPSYDVLLSEMIPFTCLDGYCPTPSLPPLSPSRRGVCHCTCLGIGYTSLEAGWL